MSSFFFLSFSVGFFFFFGVGGGGSNPSDTSCLFTVACFNLFLICLRSDYLHVSFPNYNKWLHHLAQEKKGICCFSFIFLGLVCSYSLFLTTFSRYLPDLSDVAIYPYIRSSLILLAFTNMLVL